jgi:hypothetical protein
MAAASIVGIAGSLVLRGARGARIVVVPRLGGRVLRAVLPDGFEAGWVDEAAARRERNPNERFHNVGGLDRLWIGPEGGPFGFFFDPGAPAVGERWRVPAAIDRLRLRVVRSSPGRVALAGRAHLVGRSGARFSLGIGREITAMSESQLSARLGRLPPGVAAAGVITKNTITNLGARAWRATEGIPQIWILGQFPAGARARVLVPLARAAAPVEDGYFGPPGARRLRRSGRKVVFAADGRRVSKIGIGPRATTGRAGAHDPARSLLTIVRFEVRRGGRYANFLWSPPAGRPWGGDAFQSYNSGDGSFFELESVSPARALRPGSSAVHRHETLFLRGPRAALATLTKRTLGIDLGA